MRLIDADTLKARIQAWKDRLKGYYGKNDDMVITLDKVQKQIIDDMPTVDAVPVVRCSECKHNIGEKVWLDGEMTIDCANGMGYPPPNWFCADGERRSE